MLRKLSTVLLSVVVVAVLAACGGADGSDGPVVFAAASLTDVFPVVDPAAEYSFAGSDTLAIQIREGAKADVFAAASPKYPEELFQEGLVEKPQVFATNRLVLIVPKDDRNGVAGIGDLRRPGVKLVVAAEGVPVGDYTRAALEHLGETGVLANVVSEEDDVRAVVGKVALGEADAGFVYATDVASAADDVRVIELPAAAQPEIEYEIAVVTAGEHGAAADAFVERVLGPDGRRALSDAGFGLP